MCVAQGHSKDRKALFVTMGLNFRIILHIMGLLLLCNGSFMLLAGLVSGIYKDGATLDILLAAIVTMLIGTMAMFYTRGHRKEVKRKEGYIIVTFGWLVTCHPRSLITQQK